ncbi:DUF3016 domain-containing protein [Iodobacter sp. HSC-16F04]|uniref:DUF3016 domain-containing protein n=1 Tax=Iodobacter violaceini TaxID=3044271 RepID=A0ABX0KX22_9NEIS|nr:DUF3016 domain-containing protein [Iodobacter violacea]NHQ88562.1 DUF3016 domain-containing protein [Iodobacter violacea]
MKKIFLSLSLLALTVSNAWAGEAKITWQNPEKFSDIRASHEREDRFQERLFKHFDKVFTDLAAQLPSDAKLEITVTDFDLAGEINPRPGSRYNDIRIIKDIYSPKITFNYVFSYKDQIVSGAENLRDLNFMSGLGRSGQRAEFEYEEKMIRKWFAKLQKNQTFPAQ